MSNTTELDNQVDGKDVKKLEIKKDKRVRGGKVMFDIIKNVIIQENKLLLQKIASKYKMDIDYLMDVYIKPEYYLPIVDPK